ncbi:MAG: hypothetical protein F6K25_30820 [Okeania sp. SIO2G4]|nr:hypothetical protein [Okeania sp. SIO2G4]NEP75928.1 hypothetical protein [Okeania sp. SIO2G5]NEQ94790.1 hypothetical protein [Okeania sp. SIO2G4]
MHHFSCVSPLRWWCIVMEKEVWGDGDPPLTPPVEGNLGIWGDGECGKN